MFYNYVLQSPVVKRISTTGQSPVVKRSSTTGQSPKNGNLYVGYAIDLRKRLKEHNQGLVFSTKPYRPWRLIYYEACLNKEDAKRREHYLKTTQGRRLLKRRLKEYFYKNK